MIKTVAFTAVMSFVSMNAFSASMPAENIAGVISVELGKFYGSYSKNVTDSSFSDCLEYTKKAARPLVIIWAANASGYNNFLENLATDNRRFIGRLQTKKCCYSLWYGYGGAAGEAASFAQSVCGASLTSPVVAFYGVCEDGFVVKSPGGTFSSMATLEGHINTFVNNFNKLATQHKYTPPQASAGFAIKDGELKVTVETETVYVPFIRTNSLDKAETNWLEVIYPGGEISTNEFEWVQGGEYLDVKLELAGKLTNVNDKATLVLLNTNHLAVATNSITCVAQPANACAFPHLPGAIVTPGYGEWTTDAALIKSAGDGFFLAVNGGVVWDAGLRAFNEAVFASADFEEWCASNKVSLVYLDKAEPETGASLFSYNVASNGNSGASFMSMNGLSATQGEEYAAQAEADAKELFGGRGATALPDTFQIAFVRADGSVSGFLAPYFDADGKCDLNETLARLGELVEQAADGAEAANDLPDEPENWAKAGLPSIAFGGEATGTLSVNDTIDCIQLTGDGWADGKVVFGTSTSNAFVTVLCRDEKSGECCELDGGLSVFATNGVRDAEIVYSLSQEDVDAGRLFVSVSGYERAGSDKKYGGKSSFDYTVSAYSATPNAGLISFSGQAATVIQAATNQVLQVPLVRFVGSDGSLDITVSLDEAATTATGRYEFAEQTLTWTNGEESVKYVPVTLKGSEFNDGMRKIVLSIKENDLFKDVESYYTVYTITYGKEPSDEGQIKVETVEPGAQPDGRIYVRYGTDGSLRSDSTISLLLNRTGGKGPAAAYISWKNGGTSMKETQEWAHYATGEREVFIEDGFPEPGKSGYSDVTISVTSSNSVPVVKDGSILKVRVLPGDAPLFDGDDVKWSGVQYTTTMTNLTSVAIPDGMTVKSLVKISGSVPAGLKVTLVDGKLVVTGTPTAGTVDTTATYWVLLERDGGGRLYSMPVTVTFKNKALADVNDGFVKARSWNGLPLHSEDGTRLAGLLDLTVSKNGKTSARYRMNGGRAVAFSAPGLAAVDESGTVSLYAEKSACCGGKWIFGATLGADGSLGATVSQGGGCADEILVGAADIPAGAQQWSTNHTAEVFGGNYVAAFVLDATTNENTLCFGSPAIRLKCDTRSLWNRGAVMFAGTLPNGKNISGTSYLVPVTNNAASATLSVFASSSSDTFAAMVDIDGTALCATPNVIPFWSHDEAGIESLSYKNNYDVIGALWSWAGWSWSGGTVNVNKTSGMASGVISVKLDEKSDRQTRVKWRGFAIPGETPRVLGSCWYDATKPDVDAQGRNRKRTVRVGDAVDLTAAE